MTIVIAPGLRRELRVGVAYNHYSLLATVEDALGLALLQKAQGATAMSAFFKTGPPPSLYKESRQALREVLSPSRCLMDVRRE